MHEESSPRVEFDDVIASLFPLDLSGQIVMLRASIDASGRKSGVYSLAAVAFGYDRAVKANRQWQELLNGRTFHMKDLNARANEFAGITDKEKDRIMRGTIGIIRENASFFATASCDRDLLAKFLPTVSNKNPDHRKLLEAHRSIYGVMCHIGIFSMAKLAGVTSGGRPQISYIFEAGDDGQRGLISFLNFLENTPGRESILAGYGIRSKTVAQKGEMEGVFHSADLLAWEWAKHIDRSRAGQPMRASLRALIGPDAEFNMDVNSPAIRDRKKFNLAHFADDKMTTVLKSFRASLVASTPEEYERAHQSFRDDEAKWQSHSVQHPA